MFGEKQKKKMKSFQQFLKDVFQQDNWYYKKSDFFVKMDSHRMLIESKKNRPSYLTFYEKNTKFVQTDKQASKISSYEKLIFDVKGSRSADLDVTLYVMEYNRRFKRIKTNRLKLNEKYILSPLKETVSIRLAIRIEGRGILEITQFSLRPLTYTDILDSKRKKRMKDIRMACIFDEFSMASFKDVVTLIPITPNNWSIVLEAEKPDLLMVESAWQGNNGTWQYQVATYNNNNENQKLKELLHWCNSQGIPTVFWNKEDPVHFDKFKNTAKLFDYVFTTDADKIPAYRQVVGHDHIYSLQFAANPIIHNPIRAKNKKKNRISFAGSYYSNRHPERKKDMDEVLNIAQKFGLDIYDRNYRKTNTDFNFPEKYRDNILGSLPYHKIDKAYKDYRLILNVNSVKYSPTMFSRRVFEGLASGTPIISSYSVGIKKTFPNLVTIYENRSQFEQEVDRLMKDMRFYRERAMAGMRVIFQNHTYKKRMEYILNTVQIKYAKENEKITLVFHVSSLNDAKEAVEIVENQSYQKIEVIFVLDMFEGHEKVLNRYNDGKYRSYLLNFMDRYGTLSYFLRTKYVMKMDLQATYGYDFLTDLMHACIYSEADIVGKASLMTEDQTGEYSENEYKYVHYLYPETAIFQGEVISNYTATEFVTQTATIIEVLYKEKGKRLFSGDKYNFSLPNSGRVNIEAN